MGALMVAVLWISWLLLGLLALLLSLLVLALSVFLLPALAFFLQACIADRAAVHSLLRARTSQNGSSEPAGAQELKEQEELHQDDVASLIPGSNKDLESQGSDLEERHSGAKPGEKADERQNFRGTNAEGVHGRGSRSEHALYLKDVKASSRNPKKPTSGESKKLPAGTAADVGQEESVLLKSSADDADFEYFLSPSSASGMKTPKNAAEAHKMAYGRRVVVVIPTLNEEESLPGTLDMLRTLHPPLALIVVADGGSTDGTPQVAEAKGAVLVRCEEKGRAKQMNAGAREAAKLMREEDDKEGDAGILGSVAGDSIFCFLHADTTLPHDLVHVLQSKFAEPSTCCAGFVPLIAVPGRVFWLLSLGETAKTWFCAVAQKPRAFLKGLRTLYGDQAICCCARDFFRVGGFDEGLPILEDADLCERLHMEMGLSGRPTKVCLVPRLVVTSGRRFLRVGVFKSIWINLRFAWAYLRGADNEALHVMYKELYMDVK